jgi:beta-lactam-binding protein with PASTA domain
MKNRSLSLLWILPFLGFLLGYLITGHFVQRKDIITPNILGKPLHEAIETLSNLQVGTRLLGQREEPAMQSGIILDQIPHPGQKIRPNQNIFVTISVKKRSSGMPDFYGKKYKEAAEIAAAKGLELRSCYVLSNHPRGLCVAQWPVAGEYAENKRGLLLFSAGATSLCIMPQYKGKLMADVERLLDGQNVRAELIHEQPVPEDHRCSTCVITDQRPAAGSIVDLTNTLHIQFVLGQ